LFEKVAQKLKEPLMPKCTINGKEIEVKDGTTIMEAFYQKEVPIAHYCYHPGLSIAGVCRLCMVEIEGMPRTQIACNTKITEGMKISNVSDKAKDSVKWALDFHLINHPLDCPICDQAGECGLQEQYMHFGKYEPEMGQGKVKKRKVVDLGERVVLDTERCILCSRCVRFTDEVSKTNELGIFNRGDRSEVGTFQDKPLNNNYSVNTVDICPVGALTAKDFRFKQRVWLLKNRESICTGCSTGCNVNVYFNKGGVYRLKPKYNSDVNGHWMCDKGRDTYKHLNVEARLTKGKKTEEGKTTECDAGELAKQTAQLIEKIKKEGGGDSIGLIVTAQYSNEEYAAMFELFKIKLGSNNVFYWINNQKTFEAFDGLLYRGDKNPNTKGLLRALSKCKFDQTWDKLEEKIKAKQLKIVVVLGPENQEVYPDISEKLKLLNSVDNVVWLTTNQVLGTELLKSCWQIPVKSTIEKSGTYINFKGLEQKIKPVTNIVSGALTLTEAAALFAGDEIPFDSKTPVKGERVWNEFFHHRGDL